MDEKLFAILVYGAVMIAVAFFASFMADRQARKSDKQKART
jgi:hypothetical protein